MKNVIAILFTLFSISCHTWGKTSHLPDSIITIDHTYMYVVSDPEKS